MVGLAFVRATALTPSSEPMQDTGTMDVGDSDSSKVDDVPRGASLALATTTTTTSPKAATMDLDREMEWVSSVLGLVVVVIQQQQHGGPGVGLLSECGLVPSLLSVLASSANGRPRPSRCTIVLAQAVQILEAMIVCHQSTVTIFHDLGGPDILVALLDSEVTRLCRPVAVVDAVADEANSNEASSQSTAGAAKRREGKAKA